ncbi:MAG: hypothetical protein HKL96_02505 [Phycisphaerales bacterium]|nr:hypothetical protein [Phycisphaerales bacterium]
MLVHVKTFRFVANGAVIRHETCEDCGQPFRYTLTRSATGKASSLYGTFTKAASARAQKDAQKKLTRLLKTDADLVPCPKCRHVNQSLIAAYRAARYRGMPRIGALLFGAGVVAEVLVYLTSNAIGPRHGLHHPSGIVVGIATAALVAALGLPLLAYMLRRAINPNRRPGEPEVPIGTPPSEMQVKIDGNSEPQWVKVPSVDPAKVLAGQWAFFRAGHLSFPPLCCQCLGTADGTIKSALGGKRLIAAPICRNCQKMLSRKEAFGTMTVLMMATILGLSIGWLFATKRGSSGLGPGIAAGIISLLIALKIRQRGSNALYRLKFADKSRGVLKIRFANPAYTALIIRDQAEKDAIVPAAASDKAPSAPDQAF